MWRRRAMGKVSNTLYADEQHCLIIKPEIISFALEPWQFLGGKCVCACSNVLSGVCYVDWTSPG